jgi:hypothetical protein
MIRRHWFLFLLLVIAGVYVAHKNCPGCRGRLAAWRGARKAGA